FASPTDYENPPSASLPCCHFRQRGRVREGAGLVAAPSFLSSLSSGRSAAAAMLSLHTLFKARARQVIHHLVCRQWAGGRCVTQFWKDRPTTQIDPLHGGRAIAIWLESGVFRAENIMERAQRRWPKNLAHIHGAADSQSSWPLPRLSVPTRMRSSHRRRHLLRRRKPTRLSINYVQAKIRAKLRGCFTSPSKNYWLPIIFRIRTAWQRA